jgi:hypothetical protein
MANSIPKKRAKTEQLRKKRAQAASALATGANGLAGRPVPRAGGDMDILAALDDRNLLGASIREPDSWKPWRALLAAAFGLPLSSRMN